MGLIVTELKPLAQGGSKDSHVPVVLKGPTLELSSGVRVFGPAMAFDAKAAQLVPCRSECLNFSVPEWEAIDHVRRGEAVWKNPSKIHKGIRLVAKTAVAKEHTLAAQLSEWQTKIAVENPDLWAINGGLATLDQVEGLPVVGQAIKAFTIGGGDFQPRAPSRGPVRNVPVSDEKAA